MDPIWVVSAGLVPYEEARRLQRAIAAMRQDGEIADVLLLLEHPPVYTKGRRASAEELPMGEDWYRMQGIEVTETDRGGWITYHGPGQLVAYPIVSLKPYGDDVAGYVRRMERVMIEALREWRSSAGDRGARGRVDARRGAARAGAIGPQGTPVGPSAPGPRRLARSARSGSTSTAASPPTGSQSTSTTTCSRSSGSCPAGSRRCG